MRDLFAIETPEATREATVPDVGGIPLAELLSDPATAAVRARVIPHPPVKASAFSVGAFNSCI